MSATVRVGTCSWADETLTKVWYPKNVRSGEARIRHYAERFDTVEANSTYYRLPDAELVANWAERTPDAFTMHVKAFGLMTRHPVKVDSLPEDLRDVMPLDERGRVDRPPRELRAEVFRRFHQALEPLRERGKLGGVLLQFPPYVVYKPLSLDYLAWAVEQLHGDEALVEFRHRSWLDEENRGQTLAFLESIGATYVIVDAPKTDAKNLVPTVVGRTSKTRTSASTGGTPRPGTSAPAAPPSASTTSIPRRSWRSGSSRCASSPARPSLSTPCSTTTAARRCRPRASRGSSRRRSPAIRPRARSRRRRQTR
jgi:uncharacterized protein YecE (DUF72 family)